MGYVEETGIAQILRDARILPIYEGTNGIQAMDLVGRKIITDSGLGANELIEDMREFAMNPMLTEMVSGSQLKRFTGAIEDFEKTVSIILNHADNKELIGKLAFDTLMMAGTIIASWQMLLSLEKASNAFNNKSLSSEFFNEKSETVSHFMDFILPRYLSNFATITAITS
jgi:hypothetical protein